MRLPGDMGFDDRNLIQDVNLEESLYKSGQTPHPNVAQDEQVSSTVSQTHPVQRNGQTPQMRHACLAISVDLKWPDVG